MLKQTATALILSTAIAAPATAGCFTHGCDDGGTHLNNDRGTYERDRGTYGNDRGLQDDDGFGSSRDDFEQRDLDRQETFDGQADTWGGDSLGDSLY